METIELIDCLWKTAKERNLIVSGCARNLAGNLIDGVATKSFFGKTHIKIGQCIGIWGYCMQVGGLLALKYSRSTSAFIFTFLGVHNGNDDFQRNMKEVYTEECGKYLAEAKTFSTYVLAKRIDQSNFKRNAAEYLSLHSLDKLTPKDAEDIAWEYAVDGAVTGMLFPENFKRLYEQSYSGVDKTQLAQFYSAGLANPSKSDTLTLEDAQKIEISNYMLYCNNLHKVFLK